MQAFYFQPVSVIVEHLAKLGRHLKFFARWRVVEICFEICHQERFVQNLKFSSQ